MKHFLTVLSLSAFALAGVARGEVVNVTIYNTGVDAAGNVLPNGTTPDPHYSLTATPGLTGPVTVQTSAGGFPIPPWLGDDSLSAWIGPKDPAANGPAGSYDYQTTFNLGTLDPSTASLIGQWSSDNAGLDILINGHSTSQSFGIGTDEPGDPYSFRVWHQFSIDSGFVSGVNTIDFIVDNHPTDVQNPTGVRVEFTTATAATPEPATYVLFGAGMLLIGWVRSRQSATQTAVSTLEISGGKQ